MAIRLTQVTQNDPEGKTGDPIGVETTYDGQTFHWAPGEMRSFADDGQGVGHINNNGAGSPAGAVVEDNAASIKKYPNGDSRS